MNLKNVLFDLLRPFGITNNYTGCSQLIRAIQIVLEKPDGIQAVHKQIYAVIAKEYDLQPRSVESNIRTLSDIAWKNDPARLVQIAGYPLDNRPSAVQFIEIFPTTYRETTWKKESSLDLYNQNRLTTSLEPRAAALDTAALFVSKRIRKCCSYTDGIC